MKPKRAKWYLQYVGECPCCGRWAGWKEAQYTKPPKKSKRYKQLDPAICFDWCIY